MSLMEQLLHLEAKTMAILDMKDSNCGVFDLDKPSNFKAGRLYMRPYVGSLTHQHIRSYV
jgi:hypothetical protein